MGTVGCSLIILRQMTTICKLYLLLRIMWINNAVRRLAIVINVNQFKSTAEKLGSSYRHVFVLCPINWNRTRGPGNSIYLGVVEIEENRQEEKKKSDS